MFLLVVCSGCTEKQPPGMPKLFPCKIVVKMNGEPLEKVFVQLYSEESKWGGTGYTNSSGTALLVTDGRYKGVPAGTYKVLLSRIDTEEREYLGVFEEEKRPPRKQTVIVDLKYEAPEQSPFDVEIGSKKNGFLICEVLPPLNPNIPNDYLQQKIRRITKQTNHSQPVNP
jgi:hypothetical protein